MMKEKNTDHSIVAAENLKDSAFFENVSQSYLDEIASSAIIMKAEKDDVIYTAGEENLAGIFLLLSGLVKLFRKGEDTTLDNTEDILKEKLSIHYPYFMRKNGEKPLQQAHIVDYFSYQNKPYLIYAILNQSSIKYYMVKLLYNLIVISYAGFY
ncbi:MAG: hypothetical protein Ct9H300mP29_3600 [Candidatus Neomarinimicrobiota bacterium]|nr:MAG: hypothetical protein Ct9H300mP29_3600 [Candidatus Neomarinimicrobiota bacterium]